MRRYNVSLPKDCDLFFGLHCIKHPQNWLELGWPLTQPSMSERLEADGCWTILGASSERRCGCRRWTATCRLHGPMTSKRDTRMCKKLRKSIQNACILNMLRYAAINLTRLSSHFYTVDDIINIFFEHIFMYILFPQFSGSVSFFMIFAASSSQRAPEPAPAACLSRRH